MLRVFVSLLAAMAFSIQLAIAADFKAGTHYQLLSAPVITSDKTKIEVVELFWYGCGHCYKFEPMLQAWKKQQSDDVIVIGQPAMWNPTMQLHATAFYTAKALRVLDKLHPAIFHTMHVEKNRLKSTDAIADIFIKQGVDAETFKKTFASFGVESQVKLADSRARSYGVQGTPEIIVNGKYRIASSLAGSQSKMLEVASFLIEKERKMLAK